MDFIKKGMFGEINAGFEGEDASNQEKKSSFNNGLRNPKSSIDNGVNISVVELPPDPIKPEVKDVEGNEEDRAQWGNGLEFLMSCIAMSVGLGNIWRFPFTAYENGGGAFLVPYIIVLIVIGRPLYYMEMILGQFSSRGNVHMFKQLSPAFVGVGYAQLVSTLCVTTYYSSLMALTLYYFYSSMAATLPWAFCDPEWGDICFDSGYGGNHTDATNRTSSSELFFTRKVLHEIVDISEGIGELQWHLVICLVIAWLFVFAVMLKGISSSGKAAYFLAIFPYVVMIALLVRAVTLPGAGDGIIFFIKPQWDMLLDPNVWYAAVTQAFFSLNIGFGSIVMYSSYNNFNHNINRDAMVVTTLDTFTSLLAGTTIFGILGNLAYESGTDISKVVKGGTGLAFVSYPDAIAKFTWYPQIFAVLFFMMLFILGIGSLVALQGAIITAVKDRFRTLKDWQAASMTISFGFLISLMYVTQGGQSILNLVDYFGGTFIVFILTIFEVACVQWVYGLQNLCNDILFMLNKNTGVYWRICWSILTPGLLIVILIYSLITTTKLEYQNIPYPDSALAGGWALLAFGVIQIPLWMLIKIIRNRKSFNVILKSFKPTKDWGPKNSTKNKEWKEFIAKAKEEQMNKNKGRCKRTCAMLIGR